MSAPSPSESSPASPQAAPARGPIAFMARNAVAANLLMLFLIVAGIAGYTRLVKETFPEFTLEIVSVVVAYPGATPQEVEDGIVRRIEEQLQGVEGVREITSVASEGAGSVLVELAGGTDVARALDEIKSQVDQITAFPAQAEQPQVQQLESRQRVMRLMLYGEVAERPLKELAYRVEDELGALPEVSYVQTANVRDDEISIEVPQARLRAHGLSLPQIAAIVRASSRDLPAGTVETGEREVRVRTLGRNITAQQFADLVVLAQPDGTVLRLGDIATVRDGFEDNDLVAQYEGVPAVLVDVFRSNREDVLAIDAAVQRYLDQTLRPSLPAGVQVAVWENNADILRERIGTLLGSAAIGLVLVLVALTLFLDARLAAWVAVGLLVSYVGTLAVMLVTGQSINQLSLFGFILAVGIVVDDAIVVGENVFAQRERGVPGAQAAVAGARRVLRPVVFSVLTTVAAFVPLLLVPGTVGKILFAIPIVVITLLLLSLVESLLILPHHLAGIRTDPPRARLLQWLARLQAAVDRQLKRFVDGPLARALHFAVGWPLVVAAAALALTAISLALIVGGHLRTSFFPDVEAEIVTARVELPTGSPAAETLRVTRQVQEAGLAAARELGAQEGDEGLVRGTYLLVGREPQDGGPPGARSSRPRPELGTVQIRLVGAADREVEASAVERRWREAVGDLPEARSLSFSAELIGFGAPVQVNLSHPDVAELDAAVDALMQALAGVPGVFDVESDKDEGLTELRFSLLPAARTLGLSVDDVATQVRGAFFGAEALRVQRGREEVTVYARLPRSERDSLADIEGLWIATGAAATGGADASPGFVPLAQVASVEQAQAPAAIRRQDGARTVAVTADVDPAVLTAAAVSDRLAQEILPQLVEARPDLRWRFGGEQEDRREARGPILAAFAVALFAIYALLAIPLNSYTQPLIIMAAIPVGLVGALWGSWALGVSLGLLSVFGIIGLAGLVVNDGVVLMDFINERAEGATDEAGQERAIIEGAQSRFRPVMLTTLTTFLGVAPIAFAQSLQAQFLVPMAAALAFGALGATAIQMLLVPALAALHFRAQRAWARRRQRRAHEDAQRVAPQGVDNG
jgi:multidrug efflux pump subunit AcrB